MGRVDRTREGTLLGASAYLTWGLFPLFWSLLGPSGAVEVLAHRVVWSALFCVVLVLVLRRGRDVMALPPRTLGRLTVAAVLIAVNWGLFIYGVTSDQVIETSLGYFINPLVTIGLGVLVLGETLRTVQKAALVLAGLAVVVLTVENGHPPWLALGLAFSFGFYGLMKKQVGVGAVVGLTVETVVLAPIALGYLLLTSGSSTFSSAGTGHLLLLVSTGVVTAIPLLLFAGAASRVPMSTLGLLQYVTPSMHLLLGVLFFDEAMPLPRLLGFSLVWVALAVITVDLLRRRRAVVPVPV